MYDVSIGGQNSHPNGRSPEGRPELRLRLTKILLRLLVRRAVVRILSIHPSASANGITRLVFTNVW